MFQGKPYLYVSRKCVASVVWHVASLLGGFLHGHIEAIARQCSFSPMYSTSSGQHNTLCITKPHGHWFISSTVRSCCLWKIYQLIFTSLLILTVINWSSSWPQLRGPLQIAIFAYFWYKLFAYIVADVFVKNIWKYDYREFSPYANFITAVFQNCY